MNKIDVLQRLEKSGIIAVIRRIPKEKVLPVAESLIKGGVTVLEVTVDSPGSFENIQLLQEKFGSEAVIGAGTVIDAQAAYQAIHHGADFVFSPSLHKEVIQTANRYGKIAIPGVMTPTEMITAMEWGASFVKVFPAATLGAGFFKDVKGPFPHIPIFATGGIDIDNIDGFLKAGVLGVGIGSSLINKEAVASGNYEEIERLAAAYTAKVNNYRK